MSSDTPVVGLVMIVKNEEAVIERALRSALPFISTYVIVDTGSTDRTKEIIASVFAEANLQGLLVDRPWVDFGVNRSEALSLCDGRMTCAYMMDADDSLAGEPPPASIWTDVAIDGYALCLHHDTIRHHRIQVFRMNRGWAYKGAIHEAPYCKERIYTATGYLPMVHMITRCEGARSKDPQKFVKDAAVLEAELIRDPPSTSMDHRTLFYLAQSYRDAGNNAEAERVFRLYLTVPGGWDQQRYMVLVNLIRLVSDVKETAAWAWVAVELCPNRLEAPHAFVQQQRFAQRAVTNQTFALATVVRNRTITPTDLFVIFDVYDWSMDDEMAVVARALGRHQDAQIGFLRCVLNAPTESMRAVALGNARGMAKILGIAA